MLPGRWKSTRPLINGRSRVPLNLVRALILGALMTTSSQTSGPAGSTDTKSIEQAIQHGLVTKPRPYGLPSVFPQNRQPAAFVYTPFVRIAIAARTAHEAGRRFTIDDVDAEASSPLIHIVMNVVQPRGKLTDADALRMEVVPRLDTRLIDSPLSVRAAWVRVDFTRREPELVGCADCGVVIGGFERAQL